ncbi:unnamed protein product [Discula destructiva]
MAGLVASSHNLGAWIQDQPLAALIVTLLVVCLTTRLVTSTGTGAKRPLQTSNAKVASAVPYWFPYIGHLPQLFMGKGVFLTSLRDHYPGGAFSLNILGRTCTVLFNPGLIKSLLTQSQDSVDDGPTSKRLLQTVFGYPRSQADLALYDEFRQDAEDQYKHLTLEGCSLSLLVERTATRLRHNIADFITFNSGEIDQAPWERMAEADLVQNADQKDVVEADLFELVRNFVAMTANAALLGSDFVEYFPDFWQALWRLDKGFLSLAVETPMLLPVNSAIGARRARGFLLAWMDEYEKALDAHQKGGNPGPQWSDLENISPLIQGRLENVWLKHDVGIKQRSAMDLSMIWAMNATVNPLIFWVIFRIYSDPWLLIKVREEMEPYVVLEKPAVGFGGAFESATRIEKMDLEGLLDHCPYLKASYIESLRLDVEFWDLKAIKQDTVVTDKESGSAFSLRTGSYALGASALNYTDSAVFEDPLFWKPERHITWTGTCEMEGKKAVVDTGKLDPYTERELLGHGKDFAIREILLFSAAIIAMYDIEPAHGGTWKMPKQTTTAGAKHPLTPTRVWIKSRPMPSKPA